MKFKTEKQLTNFLNRLQKVYNIEWGISQICVWDTKPNIPHFEPILGYTLLGRWDDQWIFVTNMQAPFRKYIKDNPPRLRAVYGRADTRPNNDRGNPRRWDYRLFYDSPADLEIQQQKLLLDKFKFELK